MVYEPLLTQTLKKKTRVVVSQYEEMLISLHVFHKPEHHPYRVNWAKALQNILPQDFIAQLYQLGSLSDDWLGMLDFTHRSSSNVSVEEMLHKLRSYPETEFVYYLFNQRFSLEQLLRWQHGFDEESQSRLLTDVQRNALLRPGWTRRQMIEALAQYYNTVFEHEWKVIEPWLIRAERIFLEDLEKDPIDALGKLHPRLFVKDDGLYAQKVTLYRMPYTEIEAIKVRPSTFVYPHLLLGWCDGVSSLPLAVEIPDNEKVDDVPQDLTRMLKALSDPTRLKIIRSLYLQPHCTQQLAHVHHISEAAVSKHLRILAEADYVTTERRGNYVFYALKQQEMEMILVYLRQFIEQ